MLRCPNCSSVFTGGSQKFCTADGVRLVSSDETAKQTPQHQSSRLTPSGELLAEIPVSPSDNCFADVVVPTKRASALSFQSFGLHSSNTAAILRPAKAVNGFHSFNSHIVEEKGIEIGEVKQTSNPKDSLYKNFDHASENNRTQKSGATFLIICLLGALLLFTCLAFAATYFFGEQPKILAPPVRETSLMKSLKVENGIRVSVFQR